MKKNVISVLVLFTTMGIYAQTGIGTSLPNFSSELEVTSSNKGVLVPRLGLTGENDKSTVTGGNAYPEGLLVYNDGSKGFAIGFYYWSEGKWNALVSNNTLYTYIKEKADPNSVTVIRDGSDFSFTWVDQTTKEVKKITIKDLVKDIETKTLLSKYDKNGALVDNKVAPTAGFTYYKYDNETPESRYVSVSEDVSKDFQKIIETNNNKTIIIDLVKEVAGPGAISKLDPTPAAENAAEVKAGFKFNSGIAGATDVRFAETLTTMGKGTYPIFVYEDIDKKTGVIKEVYEETKRSEDVFGPPKREFDAVNFTYTNEKGEPVVIKGRDLLGISSGAGNGGNQNIETLTSFRFDRNYLGGASLVYIDEKNQDNPVKVSDLFGFSETETILNLDESKRELVYKNEKKIDKIITLDQMIQEPWFVENTTNQATKNNQDIFTKGWVGIGFDQKSSAPNEKLRVNGSITATNSYYADYVFESYFNGYSNLKYDYKFKDLNTVNDFIYINRHLPGITPIGELEKTATGYSFNVSELSIQLLEKTEELFLHVIDQQKELNAKETRIEKLETEISDMAKRLKSIEALLVK